MSKFDYTFKIILIGDSSAKKSTIILKFVNKDSNSHISKIGLDFV